MGDDVGSLAGNSILVTGGGTGIGKAQEHYNKAISSLETRVLSKARKFEELGVAPEGKELPNVEPLEQISQQLSAPEFAEDEEKSRKTG